MQENKNVVSKIFDTSKDNLLKVLFYMLLGFSFLFPVFFLPYILGGNLSITLLLSVSTTIATILCVAFLLNRKHLVVPVHPFFFSLLSVNIILFLSSIFSGNILNSLVGFSGDIGTFGFIFSASLLLVLVSLIFNDKNKIFSVYVAFFLSFSVIALYHVLRFIFGADFLSFGIFNSPNVTLLGGWNNVAIFFGAGILISIITAELLKISRFAKIVTNIMFVTSLFFLVAVNFLYVWIVVGLFAFVILLYIWTSSDNAKDKKSKVSRMSLIALIFSIVAIVFGGSVYGPLAKITNISFTEVRPSWSATFKVAESTYKDNIFLGSGPNTFKNQWITYKPLEINETEFFGADFSTGGAFIPTILATTGALGLLAVVFLLGSFLWAGFQVFIKNSENTSRDYFITSSFLVALYFWIMLFLYVPSAQIVVLTFLFTGLFFSVASLEGLIIPKHIDITKDSQKRLLATFILVIIGIFILSFGYIYTKSGISNVLFYKGIREVNQKGDLDNGEKLITKAIKLGEQDIYYRTLSELYFVRLGVLLNADAGSRSEQDIRNEFQNLLSLSVGSAQQAVNLNPDNYQNWFSLGNIYASVAVPPFSIEGARESSIKAYEEASMRNLLNPAISLAKAQLEISLGRVNEAKAYINEALSKKANYLDAYFLLSQIEATKGNLKEAIKSAETSALLAPQNPGIFFQLGLLYYNDKDYDGAINAFGRAVTIVPEYSNARYFLALSLDKTGRRSQAIKLFEDILVLNPDSDEVKFILNNLKNDREPFANAEPPIDDKPELREDLPIEE